MRVPQSPGVWPRRLGWGGVFQIRKSPRVGLGSTPAGPRVCPPGMTLQSWGRVRAWRPDNRASHRWCCQEQGQLLPAPHWHVHRDSPKWDKGAVLSDSLNFCVFSTPTSLGWWWWAYFTNQPLRVKSQVLSPDLAKDLCSVHFSRCSRPSPSCPQALYSVRHWRHQALMLIQYIISPDPQKPSCGSVALAFLGGNGQSGEWLARGPQWAGGLSAPYPPTATWLAMNGWFQNQWLLFIASCWDWETNITGNKYHFFLDSQFKNILPTI